jgi:hypothetical protein
LTPARQKRPRWPVDQNAEVGAHVAPNIIDAFVHDLRGRVSSVTRASHIGKIRRIATILAPRRDLAWLRDIEADLRYEARGHGPNIIASFRLIGCWRLPPTTIQMPHNNRKHLIINKQARELGFRGLECAEQVSSLAGVHSRDAHMPQRLRCCH